MKGAAPLTLVATLVGILTLTPARAGSAEVGFDAGYGGFRAGSFQEDGTRLALRGGYHVTRLVEIEGLIAHARASQTVLPGTRRSLEARWLAVSAVFNFHPRETIVPYVSAGLASGTLDEEAIGLTNEEQAGGTHLAGGSRFFYGKARRAAVRVELSWTQFGLGLGSSRDVNHACLSAGFTFALGRATTRGSASP